MKLLILFNMMLSSQPVLISHHNYKTIVIKLVNQYDPDKKIPLSSSVINNIRQTVAKTHLNLVYKEHGMLLVQRVFITWMSVSHIIDLNSS